MQYWENLVVSIDKLFNSALAGSNTETLSARAFRMAKKPKAKKRWRIIRRGVNTLFFWQNDHCLKAYRAGIVRREKYLQKARASGVSV